MGSLCSLVASQKVVQNVGNPMKTSKSKSLSWYTSNCIYSMGFRGKWDFKCRYHRQTKEQKEKQRLEQEKVPLCLVGVDFHEVGELQFLFIWIHLISFCDGLAITKLSYGFG